MTNKTWALLFLFFKVSLQWVNFEIPFPKETFSMTYHGVKSQDASIKEAVFLTNDKIIIRNLETSVETFIEIEEKIGDSSIKVYFEDDISTIFQILVDGAIGLILREDENNFELSSDVIGMTISGDYGFYITSSDLHRINYDSLETESIPTLETPLKIISNGNGLVTVRGTTNTYLYNHNFELIDTFGNEMATFFPSFEIIAQHENSFGSNLLFYDKDNNEVSEKSTNGYFHEIFACSTMIVLVLSTENVFFNFTSPTNIDILTTTTNIGYSASKIGYKCYEDQFKLLFISASSSDPTQFEVNIYKFGTEGSDEEPEEHDAPIEPPELETSKPVLTPAEKQINEFNKAILGILENDKFESASQTSASVTGVLASNPLTREGIKPFFSFFEDLWFYGFHPIMYPDFIEAFTTQVDVLNMLKLKPEFLNFEVSIDWIDSDNKRYISAKEEQINAPETVFMLSSIKDIYIANLPFSAMQFFLLLGVKKLCERLKNTHKIFSSIFRFLKSECLWFTLIISIFESCIVPISFYGGIQFNFLFSFDFASKLNCVITVLLVLIVILFSFTFFALMQKYSKPETSRELLDFSQYFAQSFWLETCTRCLRGLLQGLINGFFLNRHPTQLPLLTVVDLVFVFIICKFRKCFVHTFLFAMSCTYFIIFSFLDTFLLYYTIRENSNDLEELSENVIFNFISITTVLALLSVALIKMAFVFLMAGYDIVKNLCKKQKVKKISEEQEEGLKKTGSILKEISTINHMASETLVKESPKNPHEYHANSRISKKILKIHNMNNIIEEPIPSMSFKLKRNIIKKAQSFDKNTFEREVSIELDEVYNKENMPRPSKFRQEK